MTNAIEQSKREMYDALSALRAYSGAKVIMELFESRLESYLELLRQDLSALHETARKRFEDIQSLEAVNQKSQEVTTRLEEHMNVLLDELSRMREERDSLSAGNAWLNEQCAALTAKCDSLRNRQQTSDHASDARQDQSATPTQDSGDHASCAALDIKTAAILCAVASAQRVMVEYLVPDGIRAKDAIGKMIPILDNERLYSAMRGFERPVDGYASWFINNTQCMHSFPSGEQCVFCGVGK